VNQLRKCRSKVSLSLIDQLLYSGANFVLSILLGRWFPPEQYGAYTIAFSVFLFGSGLYSAIMLEPMRVIGPGRYSGNLKSYFASVIKINYWYSLLPPIITGGVTIVLLAFHSVVAPPFITLTVSFSVILLFWLFRQDCYTAFRPDLAARGSLIYAVVLLTLVLL
jgi:hypothetical protein